MAHRSSTTRVRTTAGSCRRHAAAVHAVDSALSAAARLLPLSRCGVFRSPRRPATPLHSATGLPPAARASPRPRGGRPRLHGDGSRRKLAPTSLHPLRLPRPPNPLLRPDRPSKRCAARRQRERPPPRPRVRVRAPAGGSQHAAPARAAGGLLRRERERRRRRNLAAAACASSRVPIRVPDGLDGLLLAGLSRAHLDLRWLRASG